MVKVQFFQKQVELQGEGHKVKYFGTKRRVLPQGTNM